jgi:hypothetical protein
LLARNLIAVVAFVCLTLGVGVTWAASEELIGEGEGSRLLSRSIEREESEARREARERRRERREPAWMDAVDSKKIAGVDRAALESIASCESGGNPESVSSDGTYRGKYQFSKDTWKSVGGKGDPADAHELEQDYRAALLYARSGPSQWPVCGS